MFESSDEECDHNDSHSLLFNESNSSDCSAVSKDLNIFEGIHRRFSVQAGEDDYTELLYIEKDKLLKMNVDF